MRTANDGGTRRLGVVMGGLIATWSIVIVYVAHGGLPYNPVQLPLADRIGTRVWAPQGWAFFTRSPREPPLGVFSQQAGEWVRALQPYASPSNLFGVRRINRARGVEVGLLLARVPASVWRACDDAVVVCLDAMPVGAVLAGVSPRPLVCGLVGITRQPPIPWAWRRSTDEIVMRSQVVKIQVEC